MPEKGFYTPDERFAAVTARTEDPVLLNGAKLDENWAEPFIEEGYELEGKENTSYEMESCAFDAYKDPDVVEVYKEKKIVVALFY